MNNEEVTLFDIAVSKLNKAQIIEKLTQSILSDRVQQVITANPIMIMHALRHPEYKAMMQRAEWIIPDGTGLVWAASYFGEPVQERIPGIELLHNLLDIGQQHEWRVYLLGASSEVIAESARRLAERYPNIRMVGYRDGYFGAEQDWEVIHQIREARPHLLFIGRSADTQEPWIDRYKSELGVPLMMGVGGSFDVISGKLKRAPIVFQKVRLEWLYRLLQQPWRYKRMLELPKFVWRVVRERKHR